MNRIYQQEVIDTIVAKFVPELQSAAKGHCLKLTGVTNDVLHILYDRFTAEIGDLRCFILSRDETQVPYIHATKLIELRNSPDEAPLLILCPATLRTAAEDSFGSATFRNLPIDDIEERINQQLDHRLRQTNPALTVLLDYLKAEVTMERANKLMLLIDQENLSLDEVGNQLWQVGLLPDTTLFADRNRTKARLNYNQQCTTGLCEFSRGIYDRLNGLPIRENTIQPLLARFLKENGALKSPIEVVRAVADNYPELNFANWSVSDLERQDTVKAIIEELKGVQGSLIKEQDGSLLLKSVSGSTVKVKVKVTTEPKPYNIQELARFRIDLMQVTGAGEAECVYENFDRWNFTKGKQHYRTRDVAFDANTVEPGNYYLRVYALDEFNNVLNTNDDFRDRIDQRRWEEEQLRGAEADRSQIKGKWTSETDNFLFVVDDNDGGIESPPARREKVSSVLQSFFYYRLTLLYAKEAEAKLLEPEPENWGWLNNADQQVKSVYQAKYKESRFNFQVQVSSKLRQIQDTLLNAPEGLGMISLVQLPQTGLPFSSQYITVLPSRLHELPEASTFVAARRNFFHLVRTNDGGQNGILETFDIVRHIDAIQTYVQAYQLLIESLQSRLSQWEELVDSERDNLQAMLVAVQELDIVFLSGRLPDAQDRYTTLLVSPLHPLRLGWFVALYNLFRQWEDQTRINFDRQLPFWSDDLVELFFDKLKPTNHPLLIADETGQAFEYVGELAFGWGVFNRTISPQPVQAVIGSLNRSLIQYLQQIFDIEDQTGRVENDVDEHIVYKHIYNYLSLHPYAEQITINLFNAGEGQVFRDVLLRLQDIPGLSTVRYEIRLFVNERSFVSDGEAINRLINPATTLTDMADAFSQPGRNRLFPKLRFSLNRISDFIDNPASFDCHISFLINPFPLKPKIQVTDEQTPSFFLDGLLTQPAVLFDHDTAGTTSVWTRYISPISVGTLSPISQIANKAFKGLSLLTGASLAGRPTQALPATELVVGSVETMLLDKIHTYSDWVVTFDRHLGPEIFDLPVQTGEEPFLLDYVPGENFLGINTFLTSKPGTELQHLMAPVVQQIFGSLSDREVHTTRVLNDLRTLSGSLVMQLSRQPHRTKVLEYTGLALSKRLLERKGLLEHQFIIPLDLHRGLFRADVETDIESRADLLLVAVDHKCGAIHVQAVEVKMRTSEMNLTERHSLYDDVDSQLTNTVNRLQARFGNEGNPEDQRFDQTVRTKELCDLLLFYANRAERYGLLTSEEARNTRSFLTCLDSPCSMVFTKRGIVFDLNSVDEVIKETVGDVIFYRIGSKGVSLLLDDEIDLRTKRLDSAWEQFGNDLTNRPNKSAFSSLESTSINIDQPVQIDLLATLSQPIPQPTDQLPIQETATTLSDLSFQQDSPSTDPIAFDTFIGDTEPSKQYGILGKTQNGQVVALDLNGTHTISLFGVQGAGKSYSIGTITEMVLTPVSNINELPNPLAGVIFHYSQDQNYRPEFTSMARPNDVPREVDRLWADFQAKPQGIDEIVLLVPKAKLEERQADYPHLRVEPLAFSSSELQIQDWRFLMGAVGNQSLYIKYLNSIMKTLRNQLTLDGLKQGIQQSALLSTQQRELAMSRLSLADEYIDDTVQLGSLMRPSRLLLVDLRDEFLDEDDALGLFVIMLNIFANVKSDSGKAFNKFIVFDEAHKYMSNDDLTDNIVETIRLMRHKGVSVLIASQDPPSLPNAIIELSSAVLVHRFNSPQWLKHIQRSITQFDKLTPADLSHLGPGEAYLWATKANKKQITQQPTKILTRPRFTKHGGSTRKANE